LSTGSLKRLVQEYAQSSVIARTQLPVRLLFCGFAAAVIAVLTGNWPLAALWYGAVSGTLLLSSRIHDLAAERELPRWAPHWSPLAATGLVALVYVAVTPWVWMRGGHLGPVCVLLMLTGGSLNVLVLQHRQFRTVAAGLGPYAAFLLLTPVWAFLSEGPAVAFAVFLGVLAFLGNGLMLWRVWSQTVASEARSRAELETRRREAEAAVTAKSAFAAAVTHELRTPLSGVLAAAAELQRGAEDPRQEECAAIVAESARFMQSLLGDLLDLAKMDAGRMEVEATSFDLGLLAHDVGRFWSLEARQRGVPFRMDAALGLPGRVQGDPTRLRQILNNLISNALKFTGAQGVLWSLDASELPFQRWAVTIRVRDFGPGISPERLARLFTPFDQTDSSVARTHGGTGLGLAISRELARLMGGDLVAESPAEGGAVFTLTLMLHAAAASAKPVPHPVAAEIALEAPKALRVLVADDHAINRRTLAMLLAPLGAAVEFAEDGEEAVAAAAAQVFDVILMDLHMPVLGGLGAVRRLRGEPGPNRETPVIAVTGADGPEQLAACRAAGMDGWVAKPFTAEALYAALESACSEPTAPVALSA
jgi:two-component system, sensor histidine kinase